MIKKIEAAAAAASETHHNDTKCDMMWCATVDTHAHDLKGIGITL